MPRLFQPLLLQASASSRITSSSLSSSSSSSFGSRISHLHHTSLASLQQQQQQQQPWHRINTRSSSSSSSLSIQFKRTQQHHQHQQHQQLHLNLKHQLVQSLVRQFTWSRFITPFRSLSAMTEPKKQKVGGNPQEFLDFVNASPSPFHAVDAAKSLLEGAGFKKLSEKEEEWKIEKNGKYYLTRNQSTIIAFAVGGAYKQGNGFSIAAAHTDSPCLRLKPVSEISGNFLQVGVECYGGGLWHTWFDRDLSIAGRAIVAEKDNKFVSRLVRVDKSIMSIPNLAIHMNRGVNDNGFKLNMETDLRPILATSVKAAAEGFKPEDRKSVGPIGNRHHPLVVKLVAEQLKVDPTAIQDFELCLYDTAQAKFGGLYDEFIHSARLDNLMMSFCVVRSLINSLNDLDKEKNIRVAALFDHEEIGSDSQQGAGSVMLQSILQRINGNNAFDSSMRKSFLVSADMAHAHHPNYADKHEANHRVAMQKGLVLKENVNQRYATNSISAFVMRHLAEKHNIPVQDFCVRQDMPCGSTIGPILASNCGVRTVDVGIPQFAMHSIRETCAAEDVNHAVNLLTQFYREFAVLDENIIVD